MGASISRKSILAISGAAVSVAVAIGAFFLLTDPADSTGAAIAEGSTCQRKLCGPVVLLDCGSSRDGPLLVYSRFPERLLGDCGYWSMVNSSHLLCSAVFSATRYCPQDNPKGE